MGKLRFAAGFTAGQLSTPLPVVLKMKVSEFRKWLAIAVEVRDATNR